MTPKTTSQDCGSMSASGNQEHFLTQHVYYGSSIIITVSLSHSYPDVNIFPTLFLHFTSCLCVCTGKHVQCQCFVIDFRVFSDRLVDYIDTEAFVALLEENLGSHFDLPFHNICPNKQPPIFGTFSIVHSHAHSNDCKNALTNKRMNL